MTSETTSAPDRVDDTAPERMRVSKAQATSEAQSLLRSSLNGVLGTLNRKDGAPFASVAPYALDARGRPLLFVASIAEHTRNFKADDRVSLLVHAPVEPHEDIQTKPRLTLMGSVSRRQGGEKEDGWARYRARLPAARGYESTHDFSLWCLTPSRGRWIGGFGEIFWLDAEAFLTDLENDPVWQSRHGAVEHMNADHRDAIQEFYRAADRQPTQHARMTSMDTYGMDFDDPEQGRLRVDFASPTTPERVRIDVVAALQRARQQRGRPAPTPS